MKSFSELFSLIRNGMNIKQNSDAGGLPITRIETISDGTVDQNRVGYAGLDEKSAAKWLLQPGDLLFSHINSPVHVGKVAMYTGTPQALVHGMNLLCLRPDPEVVDAGWALHLIRSSSFRSRIQKFVNKAVNQASISIRNLGSVQVDVPPLDEQRRIAAILDQADALRAKRRQALTHVDTLTSSIFYNMFGDHRRSPQNRWESMRLEELCTIQTGKKDVNAGSSDGPYPFFTCARKVYQIDTYTFDAEAVLVAGNGDLNVKYFAGKFDAYQRTYVLIPIKDSPILGRFLYSFLDSYLSTLRRQSIGGIIKYIKRGDLADAIVPIPPRHLQQEFLAASEEVDRLRSRLHGSADELDDLFATLTSQAFSGQL